MILCPGVTVVLSFLWVFTANSLNQSIHPSSKQACNQIKPLCMSVFSEQGVSRTHTEVTEALSLHMFAPYVHVCVLTACNQTAASSGFSAAGALSSGKKTSTAQKCKSLEWPLSSIKLWKIFSRRLLIYRKRNLFWKTTRIQSRIQEELTPSSLGCVWDKKDL